MVMTFGVGELSLMNTIAGTYSEYILIVYIVETPSTISQHDGLLLHQTFGNGNFDIFANMNYNITYVTAKLNNL